MATVGKALKQAREAYNVCQSELATALGIRRSVVNHWITERRIPSANRVTEIRDALKSINSEQQSNLSDYI